MFRSPPPDWPPQPPQVRWDVMETIGAWFGAQVGGVVWAAAVFAGAGVAATSTEDLPMPLTLAASLGLWLCYLLIPDFVSRRLGRGPRHDFALGRNPQELTAAAFIGVGAQLVLIPALYWAIGDWFDDDPGQAARDLVDRVEGWSDVALLVIAVVFIAPLAEERMYRGMFLPVVTRRFGLAAGVVLSSLIFAVAHRQLVVVPGLFLFACVLAWLTASTGRLGPAVVAHMAFNATTVVQLVALA